MEHIDNGRFIKQERFEVLAILRDIYKQRTPLRVVNQQHEFTGQLLSVGADNIVFDCNAPEQISGGKFSIVIENHDAKIEFSVDQAQLTEHNAMPVYEACLPKQLVYIQRRRQLRITTPYWREFFCNGEHSDGTLINCVSTIFRRVALVCVLMARYPTICSRGWCLIRLSWIWGITASSR